MNYLNYVGRFVSVIFLPLQILNPIISVLIVSIVITLIIAIFKRRVFGKEEFKIVKREMDEIREKLFKSKNQSDELIKRLMYLNKILFKQTTKILILSLILGIVCLSWVQYNYSGNYVRLPIPIPFFQNLNMVYFYIILTFIISIVLSKLLEVSL